MKTALATALIVLATLCCTSCANEVRDLVVGISESGVLPEILQDVIDAQIDAASAAYEQYQ